MAKRAKTPTQLSYVTSSYAPGYRDLTLILTDSAGNNFELRLPPGKVQTLIYACADVVEQIGAPHPPIDWEQYRARINWPVVTPWMNGPAKDEKEPPCRDDSNVVGTAGECIKCNADQGEAGRCA